MRAIVIAVLMFVAMLYTIVALRMIDADAIPDLTKGQSQQHSNPWLRPMSVRA